MRAIIVALGLTAGLIGTAGEANAQYGYPGNGSRVYGGYGRVPYYGRTYAPPAYGYGYGYPGYGAYNSAYRYGYGGYNNFYTPGFGYPGYGYGSSGYRFGFSYGSGYRF